MHTRHLLSLVLSASSVAACGKGDNVHEVPLVDFAHAYPEAPRALRANVGWPWSSGRALGVLPAPHHGALLAADRDNLALVRIARATLEPEASLALGGVPEQLVVLPDGSALVTVRSLGAIARISPELALADLRVIGRETFGLAVSADRQRVYVTLPTEATLVTLDSALDELARTPTLAAPRGVAVTADGSVVVAHQSADALRFRVGDDGVAAEEVAIERLRRQNPGDLVSGVLTPRAGGLNITGGRAIAIHPETGQPLIAHALAFTGTLFEEDGEVIAAPSPQPAYYVDTTSTATREIAPALPIEVTVSSSETPPEIELPVTDPLTGMPLAQMIDQPSDILHHPTQSLLFITGLGTDNVLVLSTAEGDPMRSPVALIEVGQAPTAIAFSEDGATAYVLNSHELSVSAIDLTPLLTLVPPVDLLLRQGGSSFFNTFGAEVVGDRAYTWDQTETSPRVAPIRLRETQRRAFARDPLSREQRRGLRLFTFTKNDDVSRGGAFACASCHIDGGEDKLVWLTNEGPRQTPALSGRLAGTAPFSWDGARAELQANMQATVERMGGDGLAPADLASLERFLLGQLPPPASPFAPGAGQLTPLQQRGRAIFNSREVGCAGCHRPEQHFNDGLAHDVGTAGWLDEQRVAADLAAGIAEPRPAGLFNTPTLEGLFYTAPYFHDGSAPTLADVIWRTRGTMGGTAEITPEDQEALIAYLLTL